MKKAMKTTSLLIAAALLCGSVTGCQNTAENKKVINYNNAALSRYNAPMIDESDGFYYTYGMFYQYIDPETNAAALICGKPDCKHEASPEGGCTAFMLDWNASELYYYQDHLYYTNRSANLVQSDRMAANEKEVLTNASSFVKERAENAVNQNEKLSRNLTQMSICGVRDEKMYLLVKEELAWKMEDASFWSGTYTQVYALITYDLKSGEVKRCEDQTLCSLIEENPIHYNLNVKVCGDLLIVGVNTTKTEPLPIPEDYWTNKDKWSGNPPEEKDMGEFIYYVYDLSEQKIIKEIRFPDTETNALQFRFTVNPDETFLIKERQADGTYQCTEYNQNGEETAAFAVEQDVYLQKYNGVYYYEIYEVVDDTIRKVGDLNQYNTTTKKAGTVALGENMNMQEIIGDVMLVYGSPDDSAKMSLVDMSCFDTKNLEFLPVKGIKG